MILINCKNKILGRISSIVTKIISNMIFFKKKIFFFIFNINYIIVKKKKYFKHSGYIGNIKNLKLTNINLIKKSIFKMLPKNKKKFLIMKKMFFFDEII